MFKGLTTEKLLAQSAFLLAFLTSICAGQGAFADEMLRPKSYDGFSKAVTGYKEPDKQTHYFVPGSQVAWANYPALRRDFPQLQALSNDQIDNWIVFNFAYISEMQLRLRGLRSSAFEVDMTKPSTFVHPVSYHRAAVAQVHADANGTALDPAAVDSSVGLVDIKGTGQSYERAVDEQIKKFEKIQPDQQKELDAFRTDDHSDGLMSFGEAVAETSRQLAVQASFDVYNAERGTSFQTVESYFIIQLPIGILKKGTNQDPAAIYGRQAHYRGPPGIYVPKDSYTDDFGGRQATIFESAVDFGGVVITQPDLQKTFGDPANYKGVGATRADAQKSNAWIYGHQAAEGFIQLNGHDHAAARNALNQHFLTMLSPLDEKMKSIPARSRAQDYASYLFSRLKIGNTNSQISILSHFLQLDPALMSPFLPLIFRMKEPSSIVAPLLKTLLGSSHFAENAEAKKQLLALAVQYTEVMPNQTWLVHSVVLGDFEKKTVLSASDLDDIVAIALWRYNDSLREQALTLLAKAPVDQLLPYVPRVFNSQIGGAFEASFMNLLFDDVTFRQRQPQWYEYVLARAKNFTGIDADHVANSILNYLKKTDTKEFLTLAVSFLTNADRGVQVTAMKHLLLADAKAALMQKDLILSQGSTEVMRLFLEGMLETKMMAATDTDFKVMLKVATSRIIAADKNEHLGEFINLVPKTLVSEFKAEILAALQSKNDNGIRYGQVKFWQLDLASQKELVPQLLDNGVYFNWFLENFYIIYEGDTLKQMSQLLLQVANDPQASTTARLNARILLTRSGKKSAQDLLKTMSVKNLVDWLTTANRKVQITAADLLGHHSIAELSPYMKTIMNSIHNEARAAFAVSYLQNQLPIGLSDRYIFLDYYLQVWDSSRDSLVPLLVALSADQDPRLLHFIEQALATNPVVVITATELLLTRPMDQILGLLPRLENNKLIASIATALAAKSEFSHLKPAERLDLLRSLATVYPPPLSRSIGEILLTQLQTTTDPMQASVLYAAIATTTNDHNTLVKAQKIILGNVNSNFKSSVKVWNEFLLSIQNRKDILNQLHSQLVPDLAAPVAQVLNGSVLRCEALFTR